MNRKKILICLNAQDDAQLEIGFIEKQLAHPHHLIMKFYLESIIRDEYAGVHALANAQPVLSTVNVLESATQETGKGQAENYISSSVRELLTESHYTDLLIIRSYNFYASCTYYGRKFSRNRAALPWSFLISQP